MLFGGETLKDFGFALLVGVASGTYSSIFIAAPVLTHWKERETVWRRRERIVLEDHGGFIPAYAEGYLGEKEQIAAPRRERRLPGRRKEAPEPAPEPAVAEPVAQATAVEEPPAEPETPAPAPARPVTAGRPRTPEERRAARRAARAAAQAADGERSPAEPPTGDGIHEQKKKPKRQSGKKKHGRSR
jgi:SecD/SecF fusion protein